jgi:hypothetical protein
MRVLFSEYPRMLWSKSKEDVACENRQLSKKWHMEKLTKESIRESLGWRRQTSTSLP